MLASVYEVQAVHFQSLSARAVNLVEGVHAHGSPPRHLALAKRALRPSLAYCAEAWIASSAHCWTDDVQLSLIVHDELNVLAQLR